jgi:hypothetical protein
MTQQIFSSGVILICLALIHIGFPGYFRWKKDLSAASLINRQMMYVHTFFIALTIFLMGIICIYNNHDLIYTTLGRQLMLAFSIFWFTRFVFQLFVYSPALWKGKRFETIVHILFTLLWMYFTVVFFIVYLGGKV